MWSLSETTFTPERLPEGSRFAVLASGSGTNLQALIDACLQVSVQRGFTIRAQPEPECQSFHRDILPVLLNRVDDQSRQSLQSVGNGAKAIPGEEAFLLRPFNGLHQVQQQGGGCLPLNVVAPEHGYERDTCEVLCRLQVLQE